MPTEVLIRIGQIAVMKMTKMALGLASRKAASEIGSQVSGGTVRGAPEDRVEPGRNGPGRLSDDGADHDANHRRQAEADRDPLKRGQHGASQARYPGCH